MQRDYKLYLNDIKESVVQIETYLKNISEEEFKKSKIIQDAVIRRLEIIGESSKNIPRSLKEKNKNIPWNAMSQFRDLMTHSYFNVSIQRIWIAATKELEKIKEGIKEIKLV
jgi:uncharacterized protein with HEPN domain